MDKWFFQMKTVPQQGRGCALACVATVAGVTFDRAKKAAFPRDHVRRSLFGIGSASIEVNEDRVRAALRRLGWVTRPVNDFRRLSTPSIVFLKYSSGSIHAMVWDPYIREFRDPGAGYFHKGEIMEDWRRGHYRSVTVTRRLPGAGPAPERPESEVPIPAGVSVDPETGEDDAEVAADVVADDGLCGCDSCKAARAQASWDRTLNTYLAARIPVPIPGEPQAWRW